MRKLTVFLFVMCVSFISRSQQIDEGDTRAMIQANFLYQFAVNSNWPAEVKKGNFNIVIVGNENVFKHVQEKYALKPVGAQTIKVMSWTEYKPGTFAQIVFVDKSKKTEIAKILKDVRGKNTLVVTNWEGALQTGSAVNFKTVDNSVRYELNENAWTEKKIVPGNKILQWRVQ